MSEIIYLKDILLAKASVKQEKKAIQTSEVKSTRRVKMKSALVERPKKEDAKQNGVS